VNVLTYTPLHFFWLARESVAVFFILSGFVLARPYLDLPATARSYLPYYCSRFIRLLPPCWAAIVFATVVESVAFCSQGDVASTWLGYYAAPKLLADTLAHASLITEAPHVLPVLWSLRWEILFSLLLPLYVWVLYHVRSPVANGWLALMCLVATATGMVCRSDLLEYMPMFMIGGALNHLSAQSFRSRYGQTLAWAVMVVATVLLCGEWCVRGMSSDRQAIGVARVLAVLGAAGTVFSATACEGFRQLLTGGVVQWLGRRSFSLYLVHFPIVIAAALLSAGRNLPLTVVVGVAGSIAAAEAFFWLAEYPSLQFAGYVKRKVTALSGNG